MIFRNLVKPRRAGTGTSLYTASQSRLMLRRFVRHKLAVFSLGIVVLLYLMALLAEFIMPLSPFDQDGRRGFHPPHVIRFVDNHGQFSPRPFVYRFERTLDPATFSHIYTPSDEKIYLYFFVEGFEYRFLGLIPTNLHLFGNPVERIHLFGTDRMGRDIFSRTIFGSRVSLTVGVVGVLLSFLLGSILGGISGYYGGWVDNLVQRAIELLRSIPTIPLWLGLSAALPANWSPVAIYFSITVILSLVGWTEIARVVRGQLLSLREEDFILAAHVSGTSPVVIFRKHIIPSVMSFLIASMTLAIPGMIIAETSLSFLGVGLMPPIISWGVLMEQAQSVHVLANAPWLLIPGLFVIVTVLAFNFVGDGLRDAADPYSDLR